MEQRKNILVIVGSASAGSSSEKLAQYFAAQTAAFFDCTVYTGLKLLPHFDPEQAMAQPPEAVQQLRKLVAAANGVIICTPEYIFSVPSGLKNALEWCVADTVFSEKPAGIVTASASGIKGHEELKRILQTVGASFTEDTTLLIRGVKGKMNPEGVITDEPTGKAFDAFIDAFKMRMGIAG